MKKLVMLIATLLSSLMLNAQKNYVEFWGHLNYNKKKATKDSLLVLTRSAEQKTYYVYKREN